MNIIQLNKENFKEFVNSSETVLVDFYADWCMPCKMMAKVIESIADDISNEIKIVKVNIDENLELAQEYEIMSIPTVIIFKNGKASKTIVGLRSKQELLDELNL